MWKSLEERNLAIIESVMLELGVSDIEELLAKVIELKESAQHTLAGGRAKVCPECGSEIAVCMMGHYCGEKTPAAKA